MINSHKQSQTTYLLNVLGDKASCHFLVVGDEKEGCGLGQTLGLHLLEAQVIVHHLPDLLNLHNQPAHTVRVETGTGLLSNACREPDFILGLLMLHNRNGIPCKL